MNARTAGSLSIGCLLLQACGVQQLDVGNHDAGITAPVNEIVGRFCTERIDPNGFPTKVVLLVENSLSQCTVDPHLRADGGTGACARSPTNGSTVAARTRLIGELLERAPPTTLIHIAPFDEQVLGAFPVGVTSHFTFTTDPNLRQRVREFADEARGDADYEGALQHAISIIAQDLNRVRRTTPEVLPRTRYVVVLVGSGLPGLRCGTGSDTPGDLEGGWSSVDSTRCADPRFEGLPRNQPRRLTDLAASLGALAASNNSSATLHTIQLFDEPGLTACGVSCASAQPWRPRPPGRVWTAREQLETGRQLFAALGQAGGGLALQASTALDLSTVTMPPGVTETAASLNVLKSLILVPRSSTPGLERPVADSDGDRIPNADEPSDAAFTSDRDGDCFDDGLELRLARSHGFDPSVPDARGCDPKSALTPGCVCRDTDGDGLSSFEENYFQTSSMPAVDFDGDGLPDNVELAALMRPEERLPRSRDTDADGVTDHDEVLALTDPRRADGEYRSRHGVSTQVTIALGGETTNDGRICYDFAIRNVPLVDTPAPPGVPEQTGWNRFLVYAGEAPQSVAGTDFGRWRAACVWLRSEQSGGRASLTLTDLNFRPPIVAVRDCQGLTP